MTHVDSFETGFFFERNYRKRFDVVVSRIEFGRTAVSNHVEEFERVRWIAQESQTTFRQDAEAVEHLKELTGRLMDGADDGLVLLGQVLHAINQRHGHVGIETARRLITEQDGWVSDDFRSKCQSSSFATTYSFYSSLRVTNHGVFALF